jgi:hypothetical protein
MGELRALQHMWLTELNALQMFILLNQMILVCGEKGKNSPRKNFSKSLDTNVKTRLWKMMGGFYLLPIKQ